MEKPSVIAYISKEQEPFQFIASQIEIEKVLNDLERNDQILLLHCLGVRQITIQEVVSSFPNTKTSFSSFLKEWDFFQIESQTITCIRRIYQSKKNGQEIPEIFFNEITINTFKKSIIRTLSDLEILNLCEFLKIDVAKSDVKSSLLNFLENHFDSIENLLKFDRLLKSSENEHFNRLRSLIAEEMSCYCGCDHAYLSFSSTESERGKAACFLLGSFQLFNNGNVMDKQIALFDKDGVSYLITPLNWALKPLLLETENNSTENDAENELRTKKTWSVVPNKKEVTFLISLDYPFENNIKIYMDGGAQLAAEKCGEWISKPENERPSWKELKHFLSLLPTAKKYE